MKRGTVDRVLGLALIVVAAAGALIAGLLMGEGWNAVPWALVVLMVGLLSGWSAERWGRQRV